ncbi:MAG: DNA translocase FtsK 4TM domain-containing protein [bacterium]|jgi:S-DNA-T family DNA segregation ATPase FtsK/SpoIIIE|nr:DNA translocase FtsK [Candidatus Neomarinimicrobiota bacterium]HIL87025.1 DNA translocase FtsK [Candidatus Neomarinimicrobiota bacterium]
MDKTRIQIIGWLLGFCSLLILGSMVGYDASEEPSLVSNSINNPFNIVGVYVGYYFVKLGFGYAAYIIPLIGLTVSFYLISNFSFMLSRLVSYQLAFLFYLSITLGLFQNYNSFSSQISYEYSGLLGGLVLSLLHDWIGPIGAISLMVALWILLFVGFFNLDLYSSFQSAASFIQSKIKSLSEINWRVSLKNEDKPKAVEVKKIIDDESFLDDITEEESKEEITEEVEGEAINDVESETELSIEKGIIEKEVDIDQKRSSSIIRKDWKFPSTDLLEFISDESEELSTDYLKDRAEFLRNSISTFGVEGKTGSIKTGPIITLFEIEPAEGVRVNKFVQLSDDIARVMEADRVRILAPIPGTSLVGVEIPNDNPQTIYLKSVINSEKYLKSNAKLKLAIGKGILGDIAILDLVEMPHLLIAGTTGSGKSVSLNAIIVSLLYQLKPDEVKFVIIDPKKVEMSLYKGLEDHYLLKFDGIDESIITKKDNAILALRSLEKEMDARYDLLAESGKRNIAEYNSMVKKAKKDLMPYIVLMVDELADLMMYSSRDVEVPIARLAQLARAVGIHLVIATQRPSVDVITGIIKANFPARIAFQVATKIDSRTILDVNGADKLIGKGDMLYQKPGSSSPVRMHGAFVTLKEIEDLVEYISKQPKPNEIILETVRSNTSTLNGNESGIEDELLEQAIEIVVMSKQGSISLLQRRLSVGYSRAARLIDEMERLKIVGPFTGSKAREVLVDESYLETIKDDQEV